MAGTVTVFCGPLGSGKTTMARATAERHGAVLRSYDDLPGARSGSVMQAWLDCIKADLAAGADVVCDGLLLTRAERMAFRQALPGAVRADLVAVRPPLGVCIQRNRQREARLPEFVVRQAHGRFEEPTEAEGWTTIERRNGTDV